jgi:hypothetical protein
MTEVRRKQSEITELIRQTLKDSFTHVHVRRVLIEEDLEHQTAAVTCEATDEVSGEQIRIVGKGSGVIDAFFNAMVDRFAAEYPSLKTIRFNAFSIHGQMDTRQTQSATDSLGEVTVEIANSDDKLFVFTHSSRSVIGSALIATLRGLEHFINAERAFILTHHALQDARERNRQDLVTRYTNTLALLVQNTSYSEVIQKLRDQLE